MPVGLPHIRWSMAPFPTWCSLRPSGCGSACVLASRHCERKGGVNVIDNPGTVATLLRQLEDQLPISAFPTKELVQILRRGGVKTSVDRALLITRVFYAGDEGGICCDVTPSRAK